MEEIKDGKPPSPRGKLRRNHELSVTMIFTPAESREDREVERRINLQKLQKVHVDEARLKYNYKEMSIALNFLWDKITDVEDLENLFKNKDVTGLDFRQDNLTDTDIEAINNILSNRHTYLPKRGLTKRVKNNKNGTNKEKAWRRQNKLKKMNRHLPNNSSQSMMKRQTSKHTQSKVSIKTYTTRKMSIAINQFVRRVSVNVRNSFIARNLNASGSLRGVTEKSNKQEVLEIAALSFHGRKLTGEKFEKVVGGITALGSLKYLELQENRLGAEGATHVATILDSSTHLTDLTLRNNNLTSDPFLNGRLSEAIANSTLVAIDLSSNGINGEAVEELCNCLMDNDVLKFLNLSQNPIMDVGAIAIARLLDPGSVISNLVLEDCEINDSGGSRLAKVLKSNKMLKRLYLKQNALGDKSATKFLNALVLRNHDDQGNGSEHPMTLKQANAHFNTSNRNFSSSTFFGSSGDELLNTTLTVLDLSENYDISKELLKDISSTIAAKARQIFGGEDGITWTKDAWILAQSSQGAQHIANAIKAMPGHKLEEFSIKSQMEKETDKTIMEVLLESSSVVGVDPNLTVRKYKSFRAKKRGVGVASGLELFGEERRRSDGSELEDERENFNRKSKDLIAQDNADDDINGYLAAIKALVLVSGFNLNRFDSTGRKFSEVLENHPNKAVRHWAKRNNAFDGKYLIDEGPAAHVSKTCVVKFASSVENGAPLAIKFFKNKNMYKRERQARDMLREEIGLRNEVVDMSLYQECILDNVDAGETIQRKKQDLYYSTDVFRVNLGLNKTKRRKKKKGSPPKLGERAKRRSEEWENICFIVMPRMGKSLFDVINTEELAGGRLHKISEIMFQAAQALNFVNKQGMIHGDFKPRNFLRARERKKGWTWRLIDFDATVAHGSEISNKISTAYCPPERAKATFVRNKDKPIKAHESYDVWSFGVVLYELLTGIPLFVSDRMDDNLYTMESKIELINWLELRDSKFEVLRNNGKKVYDDVEEAINLIRGCLRRDEEERLSFDEILAHPFFDFNSRGSLESIFERKIDSLKSTRRTHFFLSHVQVQAAGTVKDIYYSSENVGCVSWLDMTATDLTVNGMKQGVANAQSFVQILTERIFESAYCVLELLWALNYDKEIVFVIETEPRTGFYSFDEKRFLKLWNDQTFLESMARNLRSITTESFNSDGDSPLQEMIHQCLIEVELKKKKGKNPKVKDDQVNVKSLARPRVKETTRYTEEDFISAYELLLGGYVKKEILHILHHKDEPVIPYRRRNFETKAMMEEIMRRIGFVTPSQLLENDGVQNSERNKHEPEDLHIIVCADLSTESFQQFYKTIKSGLLNMPCFQKVKNLGQWVKLKEHRVYTPRQHKHWIQHKKEKLGKNYVEPICVFVLLLTPGYFHTRHGANFVAWEEEWEKVNLRPIVAIQNEWFNQAYEKRKKELATCPKNNYKSIFNHTEILTYRKKTPRLYEHEAMLKEAARRILQLATNLRYDKARGEFKVNNRRKTAKLKPIKTEFKMLGESFDGFNQKTEFLKEEGKEET